jgi:hypothetical protein
MLLKQSWEGSLERVQNMISIIFLFLARYIEQLMQFLFVFIQGPLPYASLSSRGKEVREKGQRIIIPHYILFYSYT